MSVEKLLEFVQLVANLQIINEPDRLNPVIDLARALREKICAGEFIEINDEVR